MKQYITEKQLDELSDKGTDRIWRFWTPAVGDKVWYDDQTKDGHVGFLTDNGEGYWNDMSDPEWLKSDFIPLLSIGQMIEFLQKNTNCSSIMLNAEYRIAGMYANKFLFGATNSGIFIAYNNEELCDSLWEAVKEMVES